MSPSTQQSPTEAAETETPASRAAQGRVRGQRLEITPADLNMYTVITGRLPSREERERALTWGENDPMHSQIAAVAAALPMHALRPWHPAALSMRLREIWFNGITVRAPRPQLNTWARRLSAALQQGRRRLRQGR